MSSETGKLFLIASPLGNLADLSFRSTQILQEVDFWIVEDTRVSAKLQAHLGIKKPMRVLNEHTSPERWQPYIDQILSGQNAALLTDAGAPGISDPGAAFVDHCYREGISVDAIPGPSAVVTALMLSGFYAQRFCFLGFLGRKAGAIRSELMPFQDSTMTLVFFESSYRIQQLLELIHESLGIRRYAICREMTKLHQQVFRETLPNFPTTEQVPLKGEFTLVVEGKRKQSQVTST